MPPMRGKEPGGDAEQRLRSFGQERLKRDREVTGLRSSTSRFLHAEALFKALRPAQGNVPRRPFFMSGVRWSVPTFRRF
jgi:hypothetical protein